MRHPQTLVAAACGVVLSVAVANAQHSAVTPNTAVRTTIVADTTVPKDTTKKPVPDTTKTPTPDTTKTPAPAPTNLQ